MVMRPRKCSSASAEETLNHVQSFPISGSAKASPAKTVSKSETNSARIWLLFSKPRSSTSASFSSSCSGLGFEAQHANEIFKY